MDDTKVLVVGLAPGSSKIKRKNKSATLKRLDKWLGACDVYLYSFVNLRTPELRFANGTDIDDTLLQECIKDYNKIITLGSEVSLYFTKRGVGHFPAPHPSPLNRKFNDKSFEPTVINSLHSYLNSV
jgi:uracil-DNA glycosylase